MCIRDRDICFVGKKDYRNFVSSRIDFSSSGDIVDKDDNIIGTHEGVHEFTVDSEREYQEDKDSQSMSQKLMLKITKFSLVLRLI